MQRERIRNLFEQQAANYDTQWQRLAPFNDALHLLMQSLLAGLPQEANFLCVGAGTGAELRFLARQFPDWRFSVVEPAESMIEICRQHANAEGFAARCEFHQGYVESLPDKERFHGASAFLVSQFILERAERADFFADIARRLRPAGKLVSTDLCAEENSTAQDQLLDLWIRVMRGGEASIEDVQRMREVYDRDVAVLTPQVLQAIIQSAGFEPVVPFYQVGMIRGWFSTRTG